MPTRVLVVFSKPDAAGLPAPGWQQAFCVTPDNQTDFADFVAAHSPELVLLDPATGAGRLVEASEWLERHRGSAGTPSLAQEGGAPLERELVIGAPRRGRWSLSPEQRQVFRPDGRSCGLTTAEYDVLVLLLRRGRNAASRAEISLPVLGRPHRPGDRAVDILIHKLRTKLGTSAIVTVRSAGYAFGVLPPASALPPLPMGN